jgi:GDP-L-fucose synthase
MIKKTILLTGASGMVGQNLLEHPDISAYDILTPSSSELDLRDFEKVKGYLKKHNPEMIIHAAAKVGGIQINIQKPIEYFVDNLDMGRNIIMAAYSLGIKKLINLGSSCMYPANISHTIKEDKLFTGKFEETNEGYAISKLATTRLCQYVIQQDNSFSYKTLIPCNLYGRFDKFSPENSHLIAAIIHKTYQAKKLNLNEIEIWGDGTARREFMYAADLADVIIRSIEDFDNIPINMNIGLGYDMSVNEYYAAVAKVMDFDGKFTHNKAQPVGMERKLVNIDRQTKLGWQPKTSLEVGLQKTYEFYLNEIAK